MKAYCTAKLSPFASRVRMAIYAGDLPVEIVPAPGNSPHSPEYRLINPIAKIPALQLDDGQVIPESDTIVEYFADAFPHARLRPDDPREIARGRLLARIAELYVLNHAAQAFMLMDPSTRTWKVSTIAPGATDKLFASTGAGLVHLNRELGDHACAAADRITTGDCGLVTVLAMVEVFAKAFGPGDMFSAHPKLAAYWARMQEEPTAARVIAEMREGLGERILP
jgi:glutathione S-transferase